MPVILNRLHALASPYARNLDVAPSNHDNSFVTLCGAQSVERIRPRRVNPQTHVRKSALLGCLEGRRVASIEVQRLRSASLLS